jgi:hypothetical protein
LFTKLEDMVVRRRELETSAALALRDLHKRNGYRGQSGGGKGGDNDDVSTAMANANDGLSLGDVLQAAATEVAAERADQQDKHAEVERERETLKQIAQAVARKEKEVVAKMTREREEALQAQREKLQGVAEEKARVQRMTAAAREKKVLADREETEKKAVAAEMANTKKIMLETRLQAEAAQRLMVDTMNMQESQREERVKLEQERVSLEMKRIQQVRGGAERRGAERGGGERGRERGGREKGGEGRGGERRACAKIVSAAGEKGVCGEARGCEVAEHLFSGLFDF